jgi:hypothetical protein
MLSCARACVSTSRKGAPDPSERVSDPECIRRQGPARLTGWLKKRGCRNSVETAQKAPEIHGLYPGRPGGRVDQHNRCRDRRRRFKDHRPFHQPADVLLSRPGFGPVFPATCLANIGGTLDWFDSVDRLARCRGPRSCSTRFRPNQKQPAQATPLQPKTSPNLLRRHPLKLEKQSEVQEGAVPLLRPGMAPILRPVIQARFTESSRCGFPGVIGTDVVLRAGGRKCRLVDQI